MTTTLREALTRAHNDLAQYRQEVRESEQLADGTIPDDAARELVERLTLTLDKIDAELRFAGAGSPDAARHVTDARALVELVERTGQSTRAVARAIGISDSLLRSYMSGRVLCPYPVQFAIEQLGR